MKTADIFDKFMKEIHHYYITLNFVYNNEVYLFCEIWLTEDGGFYHSYFTEFNISMNPKPSPTWQDTDGKHSFEYTDGVLFLESSPGNNKVRVYERV